MRTDVLVIGGGTAGTMAAIKARQANPEADVLILEKANIRRSGAIAMGMDGVNTAVIPGHSTPEQYTREVTIANDGILDQKAVYQTGKLGFDVIQELESWGVKFQKDPQGNYDLKQVHRVGKYVLPMPEGKDLKTILTRQVKRLDYPEKNNEEWFCHVNLKKNESGKMVLFKRPVNPYVVEVDVNREVYDVATR
jgi:succinate dehydrogenase/fumarate reductase flavoprotein subunit